jgi:hypothetical protein
MNAIQIKRHIRVAKIENSTQWLFVAVVLEEQGGVMVAVSQPRVIKIIQKPNSALPGKISQAITFKLASPLSKTQTRTSRIQSPYVSILFGTTSEVIVGLAAQPPTK